MVWGHGRHGFSHFALAGTGGTVGRGHAPSPLLLFCVTRDGRGGGLGTHTSQM